jgi:outer membrane lipoprotein-sorting protein
MKPESDHNERPLPEMLAARIERSRQDAPPSDVQARLQHHLRRAWDDLQARAESQRRLRWERWLPSRSVAAVLTAAAALVCVIALVAVFSSPRTLYAQAMQAVRQARTIHAIGWMRHLNSQEASSVEIWYAAGRGVRETIREHGLTRVRLDDGAFEWSYRPDQNTVTKSLSRDPIGLIAEFLKPLEDIDRLHGQRDRDMDRSIDNQPAQAWVMLPPTQGTPSRYVVWLDDQNRVLRFEQQEQPVGQWLCTERVEIQYDVPVPDDAFNAGFPADARLIDLTKRRDVADRYPLAQAMATAQRLGIVLAIHEVRRVDDRTIYVMSTSRATPEVTQQFGPLPTKTMFQSHGQFTWSTHSSNANLAWHAWTEDYMPMSLAHYDRNGVYCEWLLLRRISPQFHDQLPVVFHVRTHGQLKEALEQAGQPWWLWGEKDVLTLDLPRQQEGLDAILRDVYQQTAELMGPESLHGKSPWLKMRSTPYTAKQIEEAVAQGQPRSEAEQMSTMSSPMRPSEITLEAWNREVRAIIENQDAQIRKHDSR